MNTNILTFVQSHRCNSVLDLSKRTIPIETWKSIQELIINGVVSPPIKSIHLNKSNITETDIDHRLLSIIHL